MFRPFEMQNQPFRIANKIAKNKTPNEKSQNQKTNKSFANIVKSNQKNELIPQFRKLLQEQKIQEIEEERQKDVRKSNLIIYGIKEFEESTNGDEIFVNDLLIDLESKSKVKFMTRIGDRKKSQSRPLKVVFQSPHEVYLITKNLIKLRGNLKYQSISITEDLTWFERQVIKEWANKAEERNAREPNNSNIFWRVRGSPISGLYLKKILKKNPLL